MRDLVTLLLIEARDAEALFVLLLVEYATHLRALRVAGLRVGDKPPWWRDRVYLRKSRSEMVKRLWVIAALQVTYVWTNLAGVTGAASLITTGVGFVFLMRLWANLAKGDGLARLVREAVRRIVGAHIDVDAATAPVSLSNSPSPDTTDAPE